MSIQNTHPPLSGHISYKPSGLLKKPLLIVEFGDKQHRPANRRDWEIVQMLGAKDLEIRPTFMGSGLILRKNGRDASQLEAMEIVREWNKRIETRKAAEKALDELNDIATGEKPAEKKAKDKEERARRSAEMMTGLRETPASKSMSTRLRSKRLLSKQGAVLWCDGDEVRRRGYYLIRSRVAEASFLSPKGGEAEKFATLRLMDGATVREMRDRNAEESRTEPVACVIPAAADPEPGA